jgi:dTDP-4-dehydrorhamnose reductase
MLGNYCINILQKNNNIFTVDRNMYDIIENNYDKLFNIIQSYENPIIINCAGIIPQRHRDNDNFNYFIINSLFPKMLEKITLQLNLKFIHISTNCVFNYENGNCNEMDMPNEIQPYGLSKILGEPDNSCVIRTSIIGEELINKKSFLEWILSNKNGNINGYSNYYWNGCTCLSIVQFIENVIETNSYWKGIKHIYSRETLSKYELASIINEIYNLNINIIPLELDNIVNKTLSSIYDNTVINKSIKEQIIEQKNIDLKLGNYTNLTKCRFCHNNDLKNIWNLEQVPLAGGFLKTLKDVCYERYYPMTLMYCDKCFSAFIKQVIQEETLFQNINNNGYFYYSSQIPSLVSHFKELYQDITTKYNLNDKKLIEIGCNDGVLLNNFEYNNNLKYVIGIDPSETINNITNPDIITINNFFNDITTTEILNEYGKMDYIIACNCLAHIDNINDIFKNLKLLLNDNGIIIIEVHYVKNICEYNNFDFVYHEHMSYYSINGIYNICKTYNLYLENIDFIDNHGGSIRATIKHKNNEKNIYNNSCLTNIIKDENIISHMDNFVSNITKWKENIINLINTICKTEKIIGGYGASGRTNIIMSVLQHRFDYIFDDSIFKIDNYIPIYHTKILNSNEIYNNNIKTIFILAWPYSKYIIQKHKRFIENGGRFIIILPEIKEININNYCNI